MSQVDTHEIQHMNSFLNTNHQTNDSKPLHLAEPDQGNCSEKAAIISLNIKSGSILGMTKRNYFKERYC